AVSNEQPGPGELTMKHEPHDHACCAGKHDQHGHAHHAHGNGTGAHAVHTVKDPVCGMDVDPHKTPHRATHAGQPYYFCSAGCRSKFLAEPDKYLAGKPMPEAVPEGTIYTCPMHPEVRQVGPGSC